MDLLHIIKEDIMTQRHLLHIYKQALTTLPVGKLHYRLMDGIPRYFKLDPVTKKSIYLRKDDKELVSQLKYRRVLEESIKQWKRIYP